MKGSVLSNPPSDGMAKLFQARDGFALLPRETPRRYEWFLTYCDLGVDRSYIAVARIHGVNPSTIMRAAKQLKWRSRVQRYDSWIFDLRQQAVLEAIERVTRKHQQKEATIKEREWALGEALYAKIEQMLKVPVLKQSKREVTNKREEKDAEGRVVSIQEFINETVLKPANWSMGTIAELANICSKLMRMSAGEPVTKLDVTAHLDPAALKAVAMDEEDSKRMEDAYIAMLRSRVESGQPTITVLKPGEKLGSKASGG